MKLNDVTCHFMLFGNNSPGMSVNIGSSCVEQSDKEKLLRTTLDKYLDFNCHIKNICKITVKTLRALHEVQNSRTKKSYRQ